jgi:predicted type IV restriction endonuclease
MLSSSKIQKLSASIKAYRKQYLDGRHTELDESGTRIMINNFLADVLGYKPLEEIKTEYMIKGTYADYVIQIEKTRHFLVEVKALSFQLSEKHLRQTINYGANEGIEYALLTNGKCFQFYKILFEKPIDSRLLFSLDLSDTNDHNNSIEHLQYLVKDSVLKSGFSALWNKCQAADPYNIAGILCSDQVVDLIVKIIRQKHNEKFDSEVIRASILKIISEEMDMALIKTFKASKSKSISKPRKGSAEDLNPPGEPVVDKVQLAAEINDEITNLYKNNE